jgi:hypothetical protein
MKLYSVRKFVIAACAASLVFLVASSSAMAQRSKHISATARGTSTQLGQMVNIDLRIREYSTDEDQAVLLEAFKTNGSEGLVNALERMSAKGRIAITGTLGFDVNYIRELKMEDGSRKIRFVTDRPVSFGEIWGARRSRDFDITMGEIIIRKGRNNSTGTLMPAARVRLNRQGELEIETLQNPWNLANIRVW